jgi:hypothetical protein
VELFDLKIILYLFVVIIAGMMHRGTYKVKSLFTDDDKHEWLAWEWTLKIEKDW